MLKQSGTLPAASADGAGPGAEVHNAAGHFLIEQLSDDHLSHAASMLISDVRTAIRELTADANRANTFREECSDALGAALGASLALQEALGPLSSLGTGGSGGGAEDPSAGVCDQAVAREIRMLLHAGLDARTAMREANQLVREHGRRSWCESLMKPHPAKDAVCGSFREVTARMNLLEDGFWQHIDPANRVKSELLSGGPAPQGGATAAGAPAAPLWPPPGLSPPQTPPPLGALPRPGSGAAVSSSSSTSSVKPSRGSKQKLSHRTLRSNGHGKVATMLWIPDEEPDASSTGGSGAEAAAGGGGGGGEGSVAWASHNSVKVVDLGSDMTTIIAGAAEGLTCCCYGEGGLIWTGHDSGTIKVWSVETAAAAAPPLAVACCPVTAMACDEDTGCVWAGTEDGAMVVVRLNQCNDSGAVCVEVVLTPTLTPPAGPDARAASASAAVAGGLGTPGAGADAPPAAQAAAAAPVCPVGALGRKLRRSMKGSRGAVQFKSMPNLAAGASAPAPPPHAGAVVAVAACNGRVLSASAGGGKGGGDEKGGGGGGGGGGAALVAWDAGSGRALCSVARRGTQWLKSPVTAACAVDWTRVVNGASGGPDTHLVTGHDNGQVLMWDVSGSAPAPVLVLGSKRGAVRHLGILYGLGLLAAGHANGKVYLRRLDPKTRITPRPSGGGAAPGASSGSGGGGGGGAVALWQPRAATLCPHRLGLASMAAGARLLATAGNGGGVKVAPEGVLRAVAAEAGLKLPASAGAVAEALSSLLLGASTPALSRQRTAAAAAAAAAAALGAADGGAGAPAAAGAFGGLLAQFGSSLRDAAESMGHLQRALLDADERQRQQQQQQQQQRRRRRSKGLDPDRERRPSSQSDGGASGGWSEPLQRLPAGPAGAAAAAPGAAAGGRRLSGGSSESPGSRSLRSPWRVSTDGDGAIYEALDGDDVIDSDDVIGSDEGGGVTGSGGRGSGDGDGGGGVGVGSDEGPRSDEGRGVTPPARRPSSAQQQQQQQQQQQEQQLGRPSRKSGASSGGSGEAAAPEGARQRLLRSESAWVLRYCDIRLGRVIGEGSYGYVRVGWWRETEVAVKILHPPGGSRSGADPSGGSDGGGGGDASDGDGDGVPPAAAGGALGGASWDESLMRALAKEVHILSSLRHPNVLLFLGVCLQPACVVTEFCALGSLYDVLRKARNDASFAARLTWARRLMMALDAAKGMLYLHSHEPMILHRDLKSPNLLVARDWRVMVGDFNLSRYVASDEGGFVRSSLENNPRWCAPEVVAEGRYSKEADVFSFGVVLWELLTWEEPWRRDGLNAFQVVCQLRDGRRPTLPPEAELPGQLGGPAEVAEYIRVLQDCWDGRPEARPSFETIIHRLKAILRGHGASVGAAPAAPPLFPPSSGGGGGGAGDAPGADGNLFPEPSPRQSSFAAPQQEGADHGAAAGGGGGAGGAAAAGHRRTVSEAAALAPLLGPPAGSIDLAIADLLQLEDERAAALAAAAAGAGLRSALRKMPSVVVPLPEGAAGAAAAAAAAGAGASRQPERRRAGPPPLLVSPFASTAFAVAGGAAPAAAALAGGAALSAEASADMASALSSASLAVTPAAATGRRGAGGAKQRRLGGGLGRAARKLRGRGADA